MKILIVDDQLSVINGIVARVNFERLGIETVLTATSAYEARAVISGHQIDILLCDIEMPGESGLELNQWIMDSGQRMIRIFLTSHTDFSYARESLRLGCFDYIVQPAPYDEIEEVLSRAVRKIKDDRRLEELYNYGRLYKINEEEMIAHTTFNLFSRYEATVRQAMELLNESGYPVDTASYVRLVIVVVYAAGPPAAGLSFNTLKKEVLEALAAADIGLPVYPLVTQNKYHQPVILLFCNDTAVLDEATEGLRRFQRQLADALPGATAVYAGETSPFAQLRDEVGRLHAMIDNNVSLKPGLFLDRKAAERQPTDQPAMERQASFRQSKDRLVMERPEIDEATEAAADWERLLRAGQKKILRANIMTYLDGLVAIDRVSFRSLCELHQQLTQMFFSYYYEHNIDIPQLFNDSYRYNDYMEGFKSVPALREAIDFMIQAMETAGPGNGPVKNEIAKAKDYILNHLAQNISVRDVADHVHLSPEYFTKLFKNETGQNIKNYILKTKVDVAKNLLENPNISVSLIAMELGYTNFSHFTQMFKKYEDVTPTDYRKKYLKNKRPSPSG